MTTTTLTISDAQRRQYQDEGYFLLDRVIPEPELEFLRAECSELIRQLEAEMDRQGTDELNLSRRNSRYFVFLPFKERPQLGNFIFSDLLKEICRATIGDTAY